MAIYVLGSDTWLLARPADLLFLYVSVDPALRPVGLRFPSQHLLEHSWATDPAGVLRITQATPVEDGELGEQATALTEVADPSTARAVPMQSRLYGGVGGESDGYIDLLEMGATEAGPAGELLEQFDGQWANGRLEFPTLLYLETYGRSRWRFSPAPRVQDAWSGLWSAELLETETELPGASGPLLRVASTVQLDAWVAPDHWYGPPGYFFFPLSMYSSLLGAVFEGQLAMSMLGATGRLRGPHWPDGEPAGRHLAGYSYAAQDGREVVSVAVVRGHLSSGHAVEVQTTTTREFATARAMETGSQGPDAFARGQVYSAAYLTRSTTLTVREPVVASTAADSPFRMLRLADDALQQIDAPTDATAFWVTRGGVDARFAVVSTDWEGNETAFAMPLMFVADGVDLADVGTRVFAPSGDGRTVAHLGGAAVALVDRSSRSDIPADAITLPVHAVRWSWRPAGDRPAIAPETVEVTLEAVGRLTDTAGLTTCTVPGSLDADGGFLHISDLGRPVRLSADRAGGLAAPAIKLGAVRALQGAVPTGSPETVFAGATLLGVPLLSLLKDAGAPLTTARGPTLRSERRPDAVVSTFRWTPELKPTGPVPGVVLGDAAVLELLTEITQPLDLAHPDRLARPSTTVVQGTLTDATISVLGIIGVRIGRLSYVDEPGATPRVHAEGVVVTFDGDLRFVDRLAQEVGGFADGSPVRVTPDGITASYTLAVPPFGFGVFSLTNVTLGAALHVPFDGPAEVRFNFAERHAPFAVGVAIFGGGGFLAITATTKGMKRAEASLEFGGMFQIAIAGLVSGEVHVLGGVALLWDGPAGLSLEGYLRCGGHVSVLDVITLSVEFELALGYEHRDPGVSRIHGRATVTVGVEVLWISESVSFTVEKSFETGDSGRRDDRALFSDRFADERVWAQVCEAFA